jgi:hypothetical protein
VAAMLLPGSTIGRSVETARASAVSSSSGESRKGAKSGSGSSRRGLPAATPGVQTTTSARDWYSTAFAASSSVHEAGRAGHRSPSVARSFATSSTIDGTPRSTASSTIRRTSTVLPEPAPASTIVCLASEPSGTQMVSFGCPATRRRPSGIQAPLTEVATSVSRGPAGKAVPPGSVATMGGTAGVVAGRATSVAAPLLVTVAGGRVDGDVTRRANSHSAIGFTDGRFDAGRRSRSQSSSPFGRSRKSSRKACIERTSCSDGARKRPPRAANCSDSCRDFSPFGTGVVRKTKSARNGSLRSIPDAVIADLSRAWKARASACVRYLNAAWLSRSPSSR